MTNLSQVEGLLETIEALIELAEHDGEAMIALNNIALAASQCAQQAVTAIVLMNRASDMKMYPLMEAGEA